MSAIDDRRRIAAVPPPLLIAAAWLWLGAMSDPLSHLGSICGAHGLLVQPHCWRCPAALALATLAVLASFILEPEFDHDRDRAGAAA